MTQYLVLAAGFVLVGVAMLGVEVLARAGRGSFRTIGEAVHTALLAGPGRWSWAGRWLVSLCWLWLGFHLLAR
jgi:hypothetical protein